MKNEEKWYNLMHDDYIKAEEEAREEKYWQRRIEDELERRRIKDSGTWWEKFVWDFKHGGRM